MNIEATTIRKLTMRLLPFICLLYFINWLDRVNLGFAALTMNKAIGLSPAQFGFGAGIFFLGYILLEVPSNLILQRVGARLWIARIMFTWGLASGAMAFVQGPSSFYLVRFLLGVAEAGFAPGILLYIMTWFPRRYRGHAFGIYIVTNPISGIIGPPLSGLIFKMNGLLGFADWQWVFLIEALPAIILSVVTLFYLPDRPRDARWLAPEERGWLEGVLAAESAQHAAGHGSGVAQAFRSARVWAMGFVYMGPIVGIYALSFWLPQIVQGLVRRYNVVDPVSIGLITALPSVAAAIGIVLWTAHSDRSRERLWHAVLPMFLGAAGLVMSAYLHSPVAALSALAVAAIGINVAIPMFWTLPSAALTGPIAAAGIAIINCVGNLGGYIGPQLVGVVKQSTGSISAALVIIAALLVATGICAFVVDRNRRPATREDAASLGM